MGHFQWGNLLFIFRISGITPYLKNELGEFKVSKFLYFWCLIIVMLTITFYSYVSKNVVRFFKGDLITDAFAVYNTIGGYFTCVFCHCILLYNYLDMANIINTTEDILKKVLPRKNVNWLQGIFVLDLLVAAGNFYLQISNKPNLIGPLSAVLLVHYYLLLFHVIFAMFVWNIEISFREINLKICEEIVYFSRNSKLMQILWRSNLKNFQNLLWNRVKTRRSIYLSLCDLVILVDVCFSNTNSLLIAASFCSMIYSSFLVYDALQNKFANNFLQVIMGLYRVSSNILKLVALLKVCSGAEKEVSLTFIF